MTITREKFIERVGREPVNDDLDRSNCNVAGHPGHWCCGWDEEADLPEFETGGRMKRIAEQGDRA